MRRQLLHFYVVFIACEPGLSRAEGDTGEGGWEGGWGGRGGGGGGLRTCSVPLKPLDLTAIFNELKNAQQALLEFKENTKTQKLQDSRVNVL